MLRTRPKARKTFAPDSVLFARMFPWGLPDNGLDDAEPGTITEKVVNSGRRRKRGVEQTSSTDNNNWLQCDVCNKWRLVAADLFERLSKAREFRCPLLIGTACSDADDWEHATKTTTDSPLLPRGGIEIEVKQRRRRHKGRRQPAKPNQFGGTYIPGFGAPLSP